MTKLIRLLICLFALGILSTLLWPQRAAAYPLAACSAAVTVTNPNDSGADSLRQALADVCSGGTVDFAAGLANQTITLTSAELSITKTVTITNPNAANLQVSGNNERRVFNIQAGAVVTMSSLSVISGTANSGGGILVNTGATLTIDTCSIKGNSSVSGGAINTKSGGILTVNNSIIKNNYASDNGGGISNGGTSSGPGTTTINGSTISNNISNYNGGGLSNYGILTIANSTVSNNRIEYNGGGIYNGTAYTLTVNNSTIAGNSTTLGSQWGGGIMNLYGTLYLRNTIIADSSNGGDCKNNATVAANLNNLIEDGSCSPALSGDPNLGPLQNNGGPTPTHALLLPSPALDAGDPATCLSTDQRGVSRPIDSNGDGTAICDIGAVEAPGSAAPTIQFNQASYTTNENVGTSQNLILTRSGSLTSTSQVQVSLNVGTATAGSDYSSAGFPQTITFGSGVVSQTVSIAITNDTEEEPVETINLTLSPLSNALIGPQSSAVLQIEDNDSAAAPSSKTYLPVVLK